MAPPTTNGSVPFVTSGGEAGVWRCKGQVLRAGEEPDKRAPALGDVIAACASQHRVGRLECVEHLADGGRIREVESHLVPWLCQNPEMRGSRDLGHGRTWTSTDWT